MSSEQAQFHNSSGALRSSRSFSRPGLLKIMRRVWIAAACLLTVLHILALPASLATLQTPCTSNLCYHGQIHSTSVWMLAEWRISLPLYGAFVFSLQLACVLLFLAVAALIFWRRPDDWLALLGATTLLLWGATGPEILQMLNYRPPGTWWVECLRLLSLALLTYFLFLFPDGRFVPRWARWLAPAWIMVLATLNVLPYMVPPNRTLGRLHSLLQDLWFGSLVVAQLYRYRRFATLTQRKQTLWVVIGIVVGLGGAALLDLSRLVVVTQLPELKSHLALTSRVAYFGLLLLVPLTFGIAILRARLFDIDGIINRTLVYAALTGCVGAIYVLIVGYLGALLHAKGSLLISLVATGLVAVVFQPLRARLQRGVNRLMYGERDEPYAVVSRLVRRLETALDPEAALPTIVQTTREALRLPYVAITIEHFDQCDIAAISGSPVPNPLVLPLTHQGEILGHLIVGPRSPGEGWDRADRQLLADLAHHAGSALHAVRLTVDLQLARARLVTVLEEERRRLRRDLHDGLGPVLAALALQADTARDLVRVDPDETEALLQTLTAQAQAAVIDIRRLVYDLRPPALDDLGLVAALRGYTSSIARSGLTVTIEAPDPFPPLPAAVEVAAYRIVQEAVTNVVKHAAATRCSISLSFDGALHITVRDNGRGLAYCYPIGVGLTSIRERARELGGDCRIGAAQGGGTSVEAWLPIREAGTSAGARKKERALI